MRVPALMAKSFSSLNPCKEISKPRILMSEPRKQEVSLFCNALEGPLQLSRSSPREPLLGQVGREQHSWKQKDK